MRILELQQGSAEWSAERAKYNTASEAPVMMGVSKKATRSDLLRIKSTGLEKEFSAWVEKNLFANGHEVEANARPIAEGIVGEELYPSVAVSDDDTLLASFDGITMLESVIWECKQWNADKAACVEDNVCPEDDRWQVVQQLAVSGAEHCLYMVTDGTDEKTVHCWVTCTDDDIQRLRDGWAQFDKDRATYEPPAAEKNVTGSAPSALPALRIELSGAVAESNLDEFRDHAIAVFDAISTDLQTDEDFADAEETVKWCKSVEQKLGAAKEHALSQTKDIDRLFKAIDDITGQARRKRLDLDKLAKQEKERRKEGIFSGAHDAFIVHVHAINMDLNCGSNWSIRWSPETPDIAGAMKGKRTIATLRDAADTAVANAKIEADRIARGIRANLELLKTEAADHETLFPDGGQLAVSKSTDDLRNTIKARIAEHQEQERRRAEQKAEAERRQAEQQAERERQQPQAKAQRQRHEVEEADRRKRGRCDGNHGGAPCGDPECWNAEPAQAERASAPPTITPMPEEPPSDDKIIECVADAFNVDHATARDWIAGMALSETA